MLFCCRLLTHSHVETIGMILKRQLSFRFCHLIPAPQGVCLCPLSLAEAGTSGGPMGGKGVPLVAPSAGDRGVDGDGHPYHLAEEVALNWLNRVYDDAVETIFP